MPLAQTRIVRLAGPECPSHLLAQIDGIFLETGARAPPPPGPEREALRERWLGRFMRGGTDVVLTCACGTRTRWPAISWARSRTRPCRRRFADIGYFRAHFRRSDPTLPSTSAHQSGPALPQSRHGRKADRGICRRGTAGRRTRHARGDGPGHAQRALLPALRICRARLAPWKGGEVVFLGRLLTGLG